MADPSNPEVRQGELVVKTFPVGPLGCNCTILGDTASGEAVVVDPGGDAELILQTITALGLAKVTRVLHTHAHFDHFLASGAIQRATGAPLALHPDDKPLWDNLEMQCGMFGIPYTPAPPPDQWLSHEEELHVSHHVGKALHTPGHTPGSTCFHFEASKVLIAGDTLFRGSIGRTDLWGGDFDAIQRSIRSRLYTLDEETRVITGHGPETSIAHELRANPYVKL